MTSPTEEGRREPIVLGPGAGHSVENPVGGRLTFKARGSETNGAVTVLESVAAPGEGPPLHVHADDDEFIYVLEGELTVRLEDALHSAPAGSFVFIPRGVVHTWQNAGAESARLLAAFPSAAPGMERFFERAAELDGAERLADGFARFADEAGMQVVGPPLAQMDRG